MSQQNENVVSLADFRKKKQETKKKFLPSLTFEPGKYYIYPELGVMVHCILLTDKFHTQKDSNELENLSKELKEIIKKIINS